MRPVIALVLILSLLVGFPGVAQHPAQAQANNVKSGVKSGPASGKKSVGAIAKTELSRAAASNGHWAYLPIVRPTLPKVVRKTWPLNPIDRFVLARLEKEKLSPSPEADRRTLLRRVSLDLTGLPPTLPELKTFLADTSLHAYENAVDRLLASPHYGEHWARRWLDLARYADTNGYEKDSPRVMWKYRDWVINALNRDMPFDEFTVEQIAGDLLPNATLDQRIATGFHRNTMINQEGGVDVEEYRWEALHDRVATTGTVFLGLTTGCARCHDHKYDPLSQKEYYQLAAFFNNADDLDIELATPDQLQKRDSLHAEIAPLEKLIKDHPKDPQKPEWEKRIATLHTQEPNIVTAMVMSERKSPRITHIYIRGEYPREGAVVEPGVPAFLQPLPVGVKPDRLALALWLVDTHNPLLPRVTVNRMWQAFFGRGLVLTSEDLGMRADPPTHPELLDWLAAEFMSPTYPSTGGKRAWSAKQMHRLIVTSATYRQASRVSPESYKRDPDNRLLARGARFRVDAETVRDIALTVSGLLTPTLMGPSVFPPQPEGVTGQSIGAMAWNTDTGPNRYRRALYTYMKRTAPYPALVLFDAPTADISCTRRNRSDTPLQALTTLNDVAFVEAAQALGKRILTEGEGSVPERIKFAFELCVGRDPTPMESKPLENLFHTQLMRFQAEPQRAADLALSDPKNPPKGIDIPTLASWTLVSRLLLNLDETLTRE